MRPRSSALRVLAALLLYWDADNDGDVDGTDLMDWDGDGAVDLLGGLTLLFKIAVFIAALGRLRRSAAAVARRRQRVRELLVFACSPRVAALPNALLEAAEVSTSVDAAIYAQRDVTADTLRNALRDTPTKRFLFIGHADARLRGAERSLGFVTADGTLAAARPRDLAALLGRHAPSAGGRLELVFLNGCRSEALGRAVRAAGVPYVVCWATPAHDAAARVFSRAFFAALDVRQNPKRRPSLRRRLRCLVDADAGAHDAYVSAYSEAVDAVVFELRLGSLANGVRSHVPRFALRDPARGADASDASPPPSPSGVPLFLSATAERRGNDEPARPACDAYAAPASGLRGALARLATGSRAAAAARLPGPGPLTTESAEVP